MAEVFRARDTRTGAIVALKKILPHVAEDEQFISMFADEARIVSRLEHPNIARALDFGSIGSDFFIAFEYVHGRDLRVVFDRAVRNVDPPPLAFLLYLFMGIGEGLSYAHVSRDEHGLPVSIVHRDVSPNNIVISMRGDVKLIDFGIAKAQGKLSRTQVGTIKGKFGYMSPEQVHGDEVDARTDVFSLGICFWELLVLKRLFHGDNEIAILRKIREAEVQPPSRLNKSVPPELDRIVLKALAREVKDRYATARDLLKDLQSFSENAGHAASRDEVAQYMRRSFPEVIDLPEIVEMDGPTLARPARVPVTEQSARELDIFEGLGKPQPAPAPPPAAATRRKSGAKWEGKRTLLGTGPATPAPPPPPPPAAPVAAIPPNPPVPPILAVPAGGAPSDHTPIMTPISAALAANAKAALHAAPSSPKMPAARTTGELPPLNPPPRSPSLMSSQEMRAAPRVAGSDGAPVAALSDSEIEEIPPSKPAQNGVKSGEVRMDWDDEDEATHIFGKDRERGSSGKSPDTSGETEAIADDEVEPVEEEDLETGMVQRASGRVRTANEPPTEFDDPVTQLASTSGRAAAGSFRASGSHRPHAVTASEGPRSRPSQRAVPIAGHEGIPEDTLDAPASARHPSARPVVGSVPLSALMSGSRSSAPPGMGSPLAAPPPPPPPVAAAFVKPPSFAPGDAFARASSVPSSHAPPPALLGTFSNVGVGAGSGGSLPPGFIAPLSSHTASPSGLSVGRGGSLPPGYAVAPQPMTHTPAFAPDPPPPAEPPQLVTEPLPMPPPQPARPSVPPGGHHGPGPGFTSTAPMPPNRLEATALVRPPPNRTGRAIAAAVGLVALGAAVVVLFVIPKTGRLTVNVTDAKGVAATHVEIFIDGKKQCDTSPCVLEAVSAGTHRVKVVSELGESTERNVTTEARKEASIDFVVAGARGTGLRVAGAQPGLKLFIDGKEIGPLPQELRDLSIGEHKIRIAGTERYEPFEKTVVVAKDEMVDLGQPMLKVVRGKATITLGTVGAKVYLVSGNDRRDLPTFPISIDIDTSKEWTLEATKPGLPDYKQPISFTDGHAEKTFNVQLEPKASTPSAATHGGATHSGGASATKPNTSTASIAASRPSSPGTTPEPATTAAVEPTSASKPAATDAKGEGYLDINSLPISTVLLDGKDIGTVPKRQYPVKPGEHTVVFTIPEKGLKKSMVVVVGPGETKKVNTKLSAGE